VIGGGIEMPRRIFYVGVFVLMMILIFPLYSQGKNEDRAFKDSDYESLLLLFKEFRQLSRPKITGSIPDFTPLALEEQKQGLKELQKRLAAIDTEGWSTSQLIDYHLVRAEMNGLEFHHRVLKPWSRNPCFYGTELIPDFPDRGDGIDVFLIDLPLPNEKIDSFRIQLQAVPEIFDLAKQNLTEGSKELAVIAIRTKEKKILMFRDLVSRLEKHHPILVPDAKNALAAVDDYRDWLIKNKDRMTAPMGVGKDNFNWWMKNVWLYPHTWDECMTIALREYKRAVASLKLEENRNRDLPPLKYVSTKEGHTQLWNEAERYLTNFIRDEGIFTIPDYMGASGPHRPWVAPEDRDGGCAEFFEQCERHDPMAQVCHNHTGHYLDHLMQQRDNRPIRGARRLYGGLRSEALAMFMEEGTMTAGLHDNWKLNPRSREVIYIALAWRAIRAIADLKMHSNEFTMEEALQHCVDWCPRGWENKEDMDTWYDLEISMQQPGHATIYITGKNELEKLLADRAMQLGEKFELQQFMDEFLAAGMIPVSLIRWEMTGYEDEIKKFL
jgi:hypothetical protein